MLTKLCTNASDTIWGEQNLNTYTWAYLDGLKIQCHVKNYQNQPDMSKPHVSLILKYSVRFDFVRQPYLVCIAFADVDN